MQQDVKIQKFSTRDTVFRYGLYAVLILFALYYLFPLYVMVSTSFKDIEEIRSGGILSLPQDPSFWAWGHAWSEACSGIVCNGLKPYFYASLRMTVPAVIISTMIGMVNGYVLSKWQFRGSNLIFGLMLLGPFIPLQVVILPLAQVLGEMGLSGSINGLILTHVIYGIGFTTLFFRNYFVTISTEIVSAARIEGAGFWRILFSIMLPLSLPIIVVTVIWQFTNIWNDFILGVTLLNSGLDTPVTVALNNIVNTTTSVKYYNVDMAATMITAVPTLLVYIVAGRYFIRGLTAGAVKG